MSFSMNRKLLILKTGSTYPSLIKRQGDFEDWIMAGLGLDGEMVEVIDVCKQFALPDAKKYMGVVVTGSHSMVTEHLAWSENAAVWLKDTAATDVPLLGICYGHQLLAYALGGRVDNNPNGLHMGTVAFHLTEDGEKDTLLGAFETPLEVQVCHTQSVIHLPEQARLLGWSEQHPNQAFAIGDHAWGVQFHPEFNARAVRKYVQHARRKLTAQGQQPELILQSIHEAATGGQILRRFAALCSGKASQVKENQYG
jgi:GMP synthase (glutamine-hydrolysing)